jgi:membrane-bound lytic murein transglycosylase B
MSRHPMSLLRHALLASLAATLVSAGPTAHAAAKTKAASPAVRDDAAPDVVTYGQRADVMQFASEVAQQQGLDATWVRETLARARFVPSVAKFIMPPPAGTAKNWNAYRARFVEPTRIRAGLAFWQANAGWLALAEERYGVPPEVVLGIIGVETLYGRHMGNFRVIDALATLSFDFPPGRRDRTEFFRSELAQYLVMVHKEGLDPFSVKGSYAGALGMPQFMPSSVNQYAVDLDGDGHIDLHGNTADVIGSVANYLARFGWQRDLPTHFDVAAPVDTRQRATLLGPDILPLFSPEEFIELGAQLPSAAMETSSKLALVELQNGEAAAPSYVAGTTNFYAITRYNWSSYYAMAVISLGETLKQARRTGAP